MEGQDYPYASETRGITVRVRPVFLADRSSAADGRYAWAYHVRIENGGRARVQLLRRRWRIVDGRGGVTEVEGRGVVGEQPVLGPGESYEYTSGTPLSSPSGIMAGTYAMVDDGGRTFDVEIPAFALDTPWAPRTVN